MKRSPCAVETGSRSGKRGATLHLAPEGYREVLRRGRYYGISEATTACGKTVHVDFGNDGNHSELWIWEHTKKHPTKWLKPCEKCVKKESAER
jgi:hypothetical protein